MVRKPIPKGGLNMTVSTGNVSVPGQTRSVSQKPNIIKQSIYETSSTANHRLGDDLELTDGRVFHYCKNGAVALTQGKVCQTSVYIPNHFHCAVQTSAAVGDMKILITLGATLATANQYAEGTIHIDDATYGGTVYKISSHLANAGSATLQLNIYDPVWKIFTTAAYATLIKNPYDSVVIEPNAAVTGAPVCVPIIDVAASYYFWGQTWGPCPVLTQGTVVNGQRVGWGGTADGSVGPVTAYTTASIGNVLVANATLGYSLINLRIAG
jgi:hypothetical protein